MKLIDCERAIFAFGEQSEVILLMHTTAQVHIN